MMDYILNPDNKRIKPQDKFLTYSTENAQNFVFQFIMLFIILKADKDYLQILEGTKKTQDLFDEKKTPPLLISRNILNSMITDGSSNKFKDPDPGTLILLSGSGTNKAKTTRFLKAFDNFLRQKDVNLLVYTNLYESIINNYKEL